MLLIITLALWSAIVVVSELLWRRKLLSGEYARKAVHISMSISIAFMPFYLTWGQILMAGLIGLSALVAMRYTPFFNSLYDIQRTSWGDLLAPLVVVVLALLQPPAVLFAIVVLHVGVADGLAAVIGTRYGQSNSYSVLGYRKSLAGTGAFFISSLLITGGFLVSGGLGNVSDAWPLLILLPLATTIVENFGVYGVDNALVALAAAITYALVL